MSEPWSALLPGKPVRIEHLSWTQIQELQRGVLPARADLFGIVRLSSRPFGESLAPVPATASSALSRTSSPDSRRPPRSRHLSDAP